jgi:hypothetical protein
MNTLNLTTLQEKLPQIVDNMLKTGIPVEVEVEISWQQNNDCCSQIY